MSAPASRAGAWPIIRAYWVSPDSGPGWRLLAAVIALDLALVWRAARIGNVKKLYLSYRESSPDEIETY